MKKVYEIQVYKVLSPVVLLYSKTIGKDMKDFLRLVFLQGDVYKIKVWDISKDEPKMIYEIV